ncbi:putative addiction module antidote protein [Lysobacteraceae bacterium NML95-0200]|nr:putative addiction module antidote protein [Xanthomonadaceae bacterium NML95-0200]
MTVKSMTDSPEDIAGHLSRVMQNHDPALLAAALGSLAKAHGMTRVAEESGLTREALYKALRPGAQPRFETVQRVMQALGVELRVVPAS